MNQRTCLVTKKKYNATDLFRFTIHKNQLVFDTHKKNNGRGGYVVKTEKSLLKLKFLAQKIKYYLKSKDLLQISEEAINQQITKLKND